MGGYESISPLVEAGLIDTVELEAADSPWVWTNDCSEKVDLDQYGLVAIDSATSLAEALLSDCARLSSMNIQVGSQKTLKFAIPNTGLVVGANTESHYMVVQSFIKDAIWKSTWLAKTGIDVLWTFGELNPEGTNIIGAALAGKALTDKLPKWIKYTLRLESIPVEGGLPRHVLHCAPHTVGMGLVGYANSRFPLGTSIEPPTAIEPASLPEFFQLVDSAHQEAVTLA